MLRCWVPQYTERSHFVAIARCLEAAAAKGVESTLTGGTAVQPACRSAVLLRLDILSIAFFRS